ncbi:MAG: hypothetical protein A3F83_09760 [Candidatus Glassbacteria bacterium RIFCSPLOWO2_12_FULL_58_11]|uniref:Sugar isomerase n=1 Tax=Candidatus Glassbacteria bacterium RIFCSPLOWO2_12_FULL_58_11 TaxID=1817867 RepID=A0A1F5Z2L8_9BACT|nr:MAG: hypothetical protein A3F83_09760 [Candidatus Glassbacteria bacterium RIFCSPLOWO2_12_FULL_58_11]
MSENLDAVRLKGLDYLKASFGEEAVERAIRYAGDFTVEVPAWQFWQGFGGGGRFDSRGGGGAARNTVEIAEDAGLVHRLTGSTPQVGMHVLWFFSEDGLTGETKIAHRVAAEMKAQGVSLGSVSPTYFLAGSGDGSLSSQDKNTRQRYIEQTILAAWIAAELGNGSLSLWFPDGTNYPGQRYLQDKISLLAKGLSTFWERTPQAVRAKLDRVMVEYKLFEPGTYSTTVPDWGTARELARIFGNQGAVLVDLGHHPHDTNVEQIVAGLIASRVRGGFHFNSRYAADDDHSVQADYQMSRLFSELLKGNVVFNPDPSANWSFALDQMARSEERIPSILKSVDALKRSIGRAALLDSEKLRALQSGQDLIGANVEFERSLLHSDTGPLVMESYCRKGLHPVPLIAYQESGYQKQIEELRAG